MKTIRLGGVPEHFNLPIHLAKERGDFAKQGIDLQWHTYEGGTGEMTEALRSHQADVCILLTEGIILDIINGNPSKIISEYVTTPLCWGIHTGAANSLAHHDAIYTKQYAVSRLGSGSHLMAIIDANSQRVQLKEEQFEVIHSLEGALDSLQNQRTDVFYWEKFTTKPYVDAGLLKRIGEFPTPWPSFVIAATDAILADAPETLANLLQVIHQSCDEFMQHADKIIPQVAKRYQLTLRDAENWYHRTEWATQPAVSQKMIQSVIFNLKLAHILDPNAAIPPMVAKW